LFNPWRSLQVYFKMCSLWQKHHYSWDNWWNTISCTRCNFTSLGNDWSPRPPNNPPPPRAFDTSHVPLLFFGNGYLWIDWHRQQQSWWYVWFWRERLKKGKHEFCEAVKVDVSKTKETNFQASIINTIAVLSVIFEDFGVAVELHERASKINTERRQSFLDDSHHDNCLAKYWLVYIGWLSCP